MNRSRVLLLIATMALAWSSASAQDDRLARRLDSTTYVLVAAELDSARAAGLPVDPLIARALEGASKNAPGARIVAAVHRLATDLATARRALGDASTTTELEAGASALRAGVDAIALAELRRVRPRHALTVPLAVLADLVARGVPPDTAARFVLTLAPATDEQFVIFQRNVERDIALGAPPIAAAAVRMSAPTGVSDAAPSPPPGPGAPGPTQPPPRRRP
jgi:hypothetical protein